MAVFDKDSVDFVIFHDPCNDGFGAAYSVWKYYQMTKNTRDICYLGANYGHIAPDVTGKNVLIVDFSYPCAMLKKMIASAASLLVIDHHATAKKEFDSYPELSAYLIFDNSHSGAWLTWDYFFPGEDAPLMIQYIEDRDLWRKSMPDTEEFNAWFMTQERSFSVYDTICTNGGGEIEAGIAVGRIYLEQNARMTREIAENATPKLISLRTREKEDYYMVANINSNVLKSDVGNAIFNAFPLIDAAAVYEVKDTSSRTTFSLRSTDFHADVGYLAKTYLGGGGHRSSSGAEIPAVVNSISPRVFANDLYWTIRDGLLYGVVGEIGVPVVILNCSSTHYAVGKYLLRERCKHPSNGGYVSVARHTVALRGIESSVWLKDPRMFSAAIDVYTEPVAALIWNRIETGYRVTMCCAAGCSEEQLNVLLTTLVAPGVEFCKDDDKETYNWISSSEISF